DRPPQTTGLAVTARGRGTGWRARQPPSAVAFCFGWRAGSPQHTRTARPPPSLGRHHRGSLPRLGFAAFWREVGVMSLRFAFVLLALTASSIPHASAHDHGVVGIEIVQPWAPAMAGQDRQLVYLTIRNKTNVPDRLMRALSPVATTVELHAAA